LTEYYERLRKFKPKLIYGYPNAISHFGDFVSRKKLQPLSVDKVICTAESLKSNQREQLSKSFKAEVYNLYCTREHGCIGFECAQHNGFHIDTGSVLVEVLQNGNSAPAGEVGDLVITDLLNYGMPFIRNKIGDRGALSLQPCACGCQLPMLRPLEGRVTDMLYLPDGQTVSGLMLPDMFADVQTIRKFQVVQKTIHEFHLNLVVIDDYDSETEALLLKEVREYLGDKVDIIVNLFPDIPNNPLSGKFQEVISEITVS
jgi:phenylacetate-CoA ligase